MVSGEMGEVRREIKTEAVISTSGIEIIKTAVFTRGKLEYWILSHEEKSNE